MSPLPEAGRGRFTRRLSKIHTGCFLTIVMAARTLSIMTKLHSGGRFDAHPQNFSGFLTFVDVTFYDAERSLCDTRHCSI